MPGACIFGLRPEARTSHRPGMAVDAPHERGGLRITPTGKLERSSRKELSREVLRR